MKLYSMVFIARRVIDDQTEIQIHPVLLIQESQEAAVQEGEQSVFARFPLSDGWIEHKMLSMEIEQGLMFDDGRRLVWQIEEPDQSAEENHGPSETVDS